MRSSSSTCGLAFPDPDMLGIDLVVPDATYLAERRDAVRGIILTHGQDHTGGLPYVLPRISGTPIYASKLTIGLVTGKLKEHKLPGRTKLNVVEPGVEFAVARSGSPRSGSTTPSRAGSVRSRARHGDPHRRLQVRPHPAGRDAPTWGSLPRGKRGVDFLLSDSTRAEREGYTLSEATVGESLRQLIGAAQGRVIMATFASNIGRVQQAIDAAAEHGRKVVLIGRSMEQNAAIATELGYLDGRDGTVVGKDQLQRLAGGAGGRDHRLPGRADVRADADEQPRPSEHHDRARRHGHPVGLADPRQRGGGGADHFDNLFKEGAMVHYEPKTHCHVSGHGSREELKLMLGLAKPRHFIPVHGEYRMLVQHALLAEGAGGERPHLRPAEWAGGRVRRAAGAAGGQRARPARSWSTACRQSTGSTA